MMFYLDPVLLWNLTHAFHWNPDRLVDEFGSYILVLLFMLFTVVSLSRAFGAKRPKNHWTRRRARAARRAARA